MAEPASQTATPQVFQVGVAAQANVNKPGF